MSYSPIQWQAINHYIKKHKLRPELSAYPILRFTNQQGKIEEVHISSLEDIFKGFKESERRRKAEEAKEARRAAKLAKK